MTKEQRQKYNVHNAELHIQFILDNLEKINGQEVKQIEVVKHLGVKTLVSINIK